MMAVLLCAGCAKMDSISMDSDVELRSLSAKVFYAAPDYSVYETIDLLSGMHASGDVEMYSITVNLTDKITAQSLSDVRLEAVMSSTAVLEVTDSEYNGLGYGLLQVRDIYNKTINFVLDDRNGHSRKYEVTIRVK